VDNAILKEESQLFCNSLQYKGQSFNWNYKYFKGKHTKRINGPPINKIHLRRKGVKTASSWPSELTE